MKTKTPVLLCVLDGFGLRAEKAGNAIAAARKPNFDRLWSSCPHTELGASGLDVGLPDGQMGNSEVGHTNIGAGRIVYQELTRISKAIEDGDFYSNRTINAAISHCMENGSALHLWGLLSDGGVHSHITHLCALLELCKRRGLNDVYVHCFMDGRDVPPTSGKGFVAELLQKMSDIGTGKIATISGRYYAMDRDKQWARLEKAYAALVARKGVQASDPVAAMQASYDSGVTDEFILPIVVEGGRAVSANDGVIFFNFRPDRAREITRAFTDDDFTGFERPLGRFPLFYVCMTRYDAKMPNVEVAYTTDEPIKNNLGEYLSAIGMKQLRIAETTKYAHVTFFFNGGVETVYEGEDRVLIDTPDVATFDLQPEMSAYKVTDAVVGRIAEKKYDVIILNYANCDMVGHTAIFEATVKAVEAVDECLGRVVGAVLATGGVALVTADHGNADRIFQDDGVTPFTEHTTNPVPFIVAGKSATLRGGGILADISPTILDVLGVAQPPEMEGRSLIE